MRRDVQLRYLKVAGAQHAVEAALDKAGISGDRTLKRGQEAIDRGDVIDTDDRRITKRSHADQKARELRDVGASTLHA